MTQHPIRTACAALAAITILLVIIAPIGARHSRREQFDNIYRIYQVRWARSQAIEAVSGRGRAFDVEGRADSALPIARELERRFEDYYGPSSDFTPVQIERLREHDPSFFRRAGIEHPYGTGAMEYTWQQILVILGEP